MTNDQITDVSTLWAVFAPDTGVYRPASSRADADEQAAMLTDRGLAAEVRPWPYDAASHPAGVGGDR
jgi:hypothetical protein